MLMGLESRLGGDISLFIGGIEQVAGLADCHRVKRECDLGVSKQCVGEGGGEYGCAYLCIRRFTEESTIYP